MSALICHVCQRVIGSYCDPQRWISVRGVAGKVAVHPGCAAAAMEENAEPIPARHFAVAGVDFLRCPECGSAPKMKWRHCGAICNCGAHLYTQGRTTNGIPDADTLRKRASKVPDMYSFESLRGRMEDLGRRQREQFDAAVFKELMRNDPLKLASAGDIFGESPMAPAASFLNAAKLKGDLLEGDMS